MNTIEKGKLVLVNTQAGDLLIENQIGMIMDVYPTTLTALTGYKYEVAILNSHLHINCAKSEVTLYGGMPDA